MSDVVIVIGSTGEVLPACMIPAPAKTMGSTIIEVNPSRSNFTRDITNIFIQEKATIAMRKLMKELGMEGDMRTAMEKWER